MTEYVNPSNGYAPQSEEMGRVFRYSGHTAGFIADPNTTLVSDVDGAGVAPGPHNAFAHVSTSGFDVTIDTGEAAVHGALLAKDAQTTVTLPESSSGTIYLAWDPSVTSEVIIDHDSSGNVSGVPGIPLYDFVTDTSSVTSQTDRRTLGESMELQNERYETSDGSGTAVDLAEDSNALSGKGQNAFAILAQNETVEGAWSFNSSVSMEQNSIQNVVSVDSPDSQATVLLGVGLADLSVQTGGSGSGQVRIYDNAKSQPIADFNEGGGVKFPNGDLETRRGWMVDSNTPRSIRKNGSDGNGIINFKTE